jgi:hypothetical protein
MEQILDGDIVARSEKTKKAYAISRVQTKYNAYRRSGLFVGLNNISEYNKLTQMGIGRQTNVMPASSLGHRANEALKQMGFSNIDYQIVNLAPKFMNVVHGVISKQKFTIGVDLINKAATDDRREVENQVRAMIAWDGFNKRFNVPKDNMRKQFGLSEMPEMDQEVELAMLCSFKHWEALEAEIFLQQTHNSNHWDDIEAKVLTDLLWYGVGATHTFVDMYGREREEWVPIPRLVCSYSETEDFSKLDFGGHVDIITKDEFIAEASKEYPMAEIEEAIKAYGKSFWNAQANQVGTQMVATLNDGQQYMNVLRYQFVEEDVLDWVVRTDDHGNEYHDLAEDGTGGDILTCKKTKYGGSWVPGSNIMYGHGIRQEGQSARIDYNIFAPNMRNGMVTSMLQQIIEPIEMFSVAWARWKDVLGKGYNGVLELNVDLIVDIATGPGGINLQSKDILDLFYMQGILLTKNARNRHDQNVGEAISIKPGSLTSSDFEQALLLCINTIRNICGINEAVDASTPKTNALIGVQEMAQQSSVNALSHYFRALNWIYRESSLSLLEYKKANSSDWDWENEYFVGVFPVTSEGELAILAQDLTKLVMTPLIEGGITTADKMDILDAAKTNMKMAILMTKNRIRKNMATARAQKQEDDKTMQETQQMAIKAAHDAKMQQMQEDLRVFAEKEGILTVEMAKRQVPVNEGAWRSKEIEAEGKMEVSAKNAQASVTKEAQRSQSQAEVQEMKSSDDARWAAMEERFRELEIKLAAKEKKGPA